MQLRIHAVNATLFSAAARALKNWRLNTASPAFFELRNAQQSFYNNRFTALPTSWSHFPLGVLDLDDFASSASAVEHAASWAAPAQRGQCAAKREKEMPTIGDALRGFATAGFNLFSARSSAGAGTDGTYDLLQSAMSSGAWLVVAPPVDGVGWDDAMLLRAHEAYFCHPSWAGFVLSETAAPATSSNASAAATIADAVRWASPYSYTPQLAADFAAVDALRRSGVPMAALAVPAVAGLRGLLAELALLRGLLLTQQAEPPQPGGLMARDAVSGWVAVDACATGANESAASLTFRSWVAIAYGARGLLFTGAKRCAEEAGLLDALALVGQQITGWKGNSVGQFLTTASLVALFASSPALVPGAQAPGPGKRVVALGPDLIVAIVHNGGNTSAPSALVIDASCVGDGGCASSWVRATATFEAIGWGAYVADGDKGFTACAKTVVGGVATITLAPGGGELLLLDTVA